MVKSGSSHKSYRRRARSSKCKGKTRKACKTLKRCKYTKGRNSYCRKTRNTRRRRRRRGGSALGQMMLPALFGTGLKMFNKRKRSRSNKRKFSNRRRSSKRRFSKRK